MQSWSMVNNGDFQKANNTVEVDEAIARAKEN